ncbi:ATP-binding protein [Actinomadura sp. NPDC049753]|uniref:ATP-binding protein n=1 Tax=Actinomadura sp. NPDC049753 TaxID=3154739 RepID=UPI0034326196
MADSSAQGKSLWSHDQAKAAAEGLPSDPRNTAPETRARYEYQDECIALIILTRLMSERLAAVLIEHSTDLILLPSDGSPELISIKHREPNHRSDPNWSWAALKKDSVLEDLYCVWENAKKSCSVAFVSNAGFAGPAKDLWKACTSHAPRDIEAVSERVARQLGCSSKEAAAFLQSLSFPLEPLPRRKEITDVAIRRLEEFLEQQGRSSRHASQCYKALLDLIQEAGTDTPPSRSLSAPALGATVREQIESELSHANSKKFLAAEAIKAHILACCDKLQAQHLPDVSPGWEPDPLFTGRDEELAALRWLLADSCPDAVSPVVIHGLTGCGKTSLALHFAATHKDFRSIFIDASVRSHVINTLTDLGFLEVSLESRVTLGGNNGSVASRFPESSGILLILDGVTDPEILRGLIPRQALCRVLITTTMPHLDDAYEHLNLAPWKRSESIEYASKILPSWPWDDVARVVTKLHDHPLAITQAANYCRLMSLDAQGYIHRLERTPLIVLDKGEAAGYPKSIVQAIRLAIASAVEREPLAQGLLSILACLGSDRVPEEVFSCKSLWTYVGEYPSMQEETVDERLSKLKGEGWEARIALEDEASFDSALEALVRLSLVRRERDGLITHPMVRLIARRTTKNNIEWLRASFGLLLAPISLGEHTPASKELYALHLESALQLALEAEIYGPAVIAGASEVIKRLLDMHDFHSALRYIEPTLKEVVDRSQQGLLPGSAPFAFRFFGVLALLQVGRIEEARSLLDENIELAELSENFQAIVDTWNMQAQVALFTGDRSLALEVVDKLSLAQRNFQGLGEQSLVVYHSLTQLLWLLNRHEEANDQNQYALLELDRYPGVSSNVRDAIYGDAVLLARGRLDIADLVKYGLFNYAAAEDERVTRGGQYRYIDNTLSYADAAIDAGDLKKTEALLAGVDAVLHNWVDSPEIISKFLGVRGRLGLHYILSGSLEKAESTYGDLLEAAELLKRAETSSRTARAAVLVHLAQVCYFLHRHAEAVAAAEEAVEIDGEFYGMRHPETLTDLEILAAMHHPCRRCSAR